MSFCDYRFMNGAIKLMANAALFAKLHLIGGTFFWRTLMTEIHRVGILWLIHHTFILPLLFGDFLPAIVVITLRIMCSPYRFLTTRF